MKELQKRAGHSSYNIAANIYAHIQEESKKEKPLKSSEINDFRLYGGRGWIRTTEATSNRFTVCPLWPLGNSSILY